MAGLPAEFLRDEVVDPTLFAGVEVATVLTVTIGVIFCIVALFTPALDRSETEEYGRPAIIFFAVAGPTPGKVSSCFSEALFRSTGPLD
jgi:hypothetical protein